MSILKLQILIIDKKLTASHRESKIHNEEQIIESRFAISDTQNVLFLPVYGIPHSSGKVLNPDNEGFDENKNFEKMTVLRGVVSQSSWHYVLFSWTNHIKQRSFIHIYLSG